MGMHVNGVYYYEEAEFTWPVMPAKAVRMANGMSLVVEADIVGEGFSESRKLRSFFSTDEICVCVRFGAAGDVDTALMIAHSNIPIHWKGDGLGNLTTKRGIKSMILSDALIETDIIALAEAFCEVAKKAFEVLSELP